GFGERVIYPSGSANAPATITVNSRLEVASPFETLGCVIQVELLVDNEWGVAPNCIYEGTNAGSTFGIAAGFLNEKTIIVKTGTNAISRGGVWDVNPWNSAINSAKYRLRVIKLA
ncbi:hypothetical protein, partial [Pectobacterium cacticida]